MSDDYTKSGLSHANLAPDAGQHFANARQEQDYRLTQASPETQARAQMLNDIYAKRLAEEQRRAQSAREFRVRGEKVKLLEEYIKSDAPRPNDPQAKTNDLQLIDERAKDLVVEKEAYFQEKIERERHQMLEQVISEGQQKQAGTLQQDADQDIEQEPEA